MNYIPKLNKELLQAPVSILDFYKILEDNDTFFENVKLEYELILSNGFPIYIKDNYVYLKTNETLLKDQIFCIVDIETTNGKVDKGQIIEIAAIKIQNGRIIDEYESLVYAKDVPYKVQELTGIDQSMLEDAPYLKAVLEEFKIFLEDHIFVAHSVSFDYDFISASLEKYNLGKLCNKKICTIDLAKRTISSPKYGLSTLKELLNIENLTHHRAYYDVLSTISIFKTSLKFIPSDIYTSEDLIKFSKQGKVIEVKNKSVDGKLSE